MTDKERSIRKIISSKNRPHLDRPYISPTGKIGAWVTICIAIITIYFQLQDQSYRTAVFIAIIYLIIGLIYFGIIGRHRLILSPEEEFALEHDTK